MEEFLGALKKEQSIHAENIEAISEKDKAEHKCHLCSKLTPLGAHWTKEQKEITHLIFS